MLSQQGTLVREIPSALGMGAQTMRATDDVMRSDPAYVGTPRSSGAWARSALRSGRDDPICSMR
jgi:hypothetical protein